MSSIFTRKALEFWSSKKLRSDVAMVIDGRVVTWKQVMDCRRERQRLILARKRESESCHAVRVTVAHYGDWLMGGWQTMLNWIGGSCWVERDGKWFTDQLMALYPVVLPMSDFSLWKQAFANDYRRRRQCNHPVGVAFLWKLRNKLYLRKEDAR